MKRETYLSRRLTRKATFVDFWNGQPTEEQFAAFVAGRVLEPYQFFYLVKYPNGGIPTVKIRYRKSPVKKAVKKWRRGRR